jgi:hypothetical protein
MWGRLRASAVLGLLAFVTPAAWGDDPHKPPADDPDPGFLEFLGSVDRLAEVNPDYLSQTARLPVGQPPRPATPPPPPPPPPPPAQSVPRVSNNND